MPTPPQHLIDLARRAHAAGAPAHILRGYVVAHVQREAAREEAVEHAMALVDALYETPGAPKVRLWTGLASGGAPRVYFPVGYVTVGADGSIGGASIQPGRRRQALTFSESSLYPSQRQAYKKALDLYRAGLLERAEEQAMARAEQIEELVEALDAAVAGEEDDEHIERQAERAAWQARHEEGRGNPDDEAHEDDLPPLVEDADYHRIYDADDFYWDVGYHWTSRAKAEKVLREGFFAPLHFFEGHESGPIYAGVISSEAAREVDRIMRKKFGPDLVLGNATFDYFADVLSNVVKKHHPEWNRIWYGKHPDDSSSYGDTCLRIDLRGIGAWISETSRDAIETEDYTYGNGLFVDAKIPAEFFSVYEGDEDEDD